MAVRYCLILLLVALSLAWTPELTPKLFIKFDHEKWIQFFGNETDYFKILDKDENSLLIGARNTVYNITLNGLIENQKQRIEWQSSDAHIELCALKGKQEIDCQNYIRVFAKINDNKIMLCGTNSYKPLCRYYNVLNDVEENSLKYEMENEIEAQGKCPFNPTHNSTYIYSDSQLYSATVADFSGADPLIYRETQRTEQYDLKQLNQPSFVNAVERNGYVFFFFREIAMEYMNCGKTVYSRIGRVCKNDRGGPYSSGDRWTSFLKTRLNCSVPGDFPFYFDEIQSTSQIIDGIYGGEKTAVIYAVFTTPRNAIGGSAICSFTIDSILESFDGSFKAQKDSKSNWLPVPDDKIPEPRPGKCVDDSRTLPSISVNFVKTHTLMESTIPPFYNKPIITRVSLHYRFSAITIDPQIRSMNGKFYDVIFVGTDDGRVIKFVNILSGDATENVLPVVISEIQVLQPGTPVTQLTVSTKTGNVIVIGTGNIVAVPLNQCNRITRCRDCIRFQDPYCIWDIKNRECTTISYKKSLETSDFLQDLTGKNVEVCNSHSDKVTNETGIKPIIVQSTHGTVSSVGRLPHDIYLDNDITLSSIDGIELDNTINNNYNNNIPSEPVSKGQLASNDNITAARFVPWIFCVLFLIVGGVGGHFVSRHYTKNSAFPGEHRNQLSWYGRPQRDKDVNLLMNTNQFMQTPQLPVQAVQQPVAKKDNLDLEFGVGVGVKDITNELKNSNESLEKEIDFSKTGTLQKVKKTYI